MALRTLTLSQAIQWALRWGEAALDADFGAMDQQINVDLFAKQNQAGGDYSPGPAGAVITGTLTSGQPTVTNLTPVAGPGIAAINAAAAVGVPLQVIGQGVPAPTYALGVSGGVMTMTNSATANGTAYLLLIAGQQQPNGNISRNGQLIVPGRGVLSLQRGDVVGVDNTGWPILLSGAAVDYQGSIWTLAPNTQV